MIGRKLGIKKKVKICNKTLNRSKIEWKKNTTHCIRKNVDNVLITNVEG